MPLLHGNLHQSALHQKQMRILFITATRLGDAVISTGILNHLLMTYPSARFTVACGPVAAGVFARMPRLERLIVVTKQPYDMHWLHLWRLCAPHVWDMVFDLRGSGLSWFLLSRKRIIIRGGRRPGRRVTQLGQALGLSPAPMPVAWIGAEDQETADGIVSATHADQQMIGLGPTANWNGKVWPATHFLRLWAMIAAEYPDARPVIFYGPGDAERDMAAPLLQLPNAIDAGGRFSIPQTAALLSRCALFVGNDSGLMHLSAACAIPTLGLFGPSRASEYAPAGPHATWIAAPGPEGNAPIAALDPVDVSRKALALLASHSESLSR